MQFLQRIGLYLKDPAAKITYVPRHSFLLTCEMHGAEAQRISGGRKPPRRTEAGRFSNVTRIRHVRRVDTGTARPRRAATNTDIPMNPRRIPAFLLAVMLLCSAGSVQQAASQVRFDRIGLGQGLPYSRVSSLLQDSRGYMWIGTTSGLGRWDGYDMRVFRANPSDSASLSNSSIWTMYEDHDGVLWIGTDGGGLNRYDVMTEHFTSFRHDDHNPASLSADRVSSVFEDNAHRLWVATSGGALDRLDRGSGGFTHLHGDRMPYPCGWGIYQRTVVPLEDGRFLMTSVGAGAAVLDPEEPCATRDFMGVNIDDIGCPNILDATRDSRGDFWFATSEGLVRLASASSSFIHYPVDADGTRGTSDGNIYDVFEDSRGFIWVGTADGLDRYDPASGRFTHFNHDPLDPFSLADNTVYTIAEDRSGNLWVGTHRGVSVLTSRNMELLHFRHTLAAGSLIHDDVSAFAESHDGTIWVGTYGGGICRLNPATGRFTALRGGPQGKLILSMLEDGEGRLWVGSYGDGLHRYDPETRSWRVFTADFDDPERLSHNDIHTLLADGNDGLWIGTNYGLNRFDFNSGTFSRYLRQDLTLLQHQIRSLYDDGSRLWVGSVGGLYLLDRGGTLRTDIGTVNGSTDAPFRQNISALYESDDGRLWIGTNGAGLYTLHVDDMSWKRYTVQSGLVSDAICAIAKERDGGLWITTHGGLSVFDERRGSFRNFDARDGLLNIQFNPGAALRASNGALYFGGTDGITYRPSVVPRRHASAPPVYLTELRIWNRRVHPGEQGSPLQRPLAVTDAIKLDADQNMITITFAALDFTAPERNRYRYFLDGLHERWIEAGNSHSATFTNLDPGSYVFRVVAANSAGIWNQEGATLAIEVLPPFWRSTWAYVLYVVLGVLVIGALMRVRERQVRLQEQLERERLEAEQLHELDHMKSSFFSNISHEFRTPLTLILGPAAQIARRFDDPWIRRKTGVIRDHAGRLLQLVNQILDLSRLEAGQMQISPRRGDIITVLRRVTDSFISHAEEKDIDLRFDSAEEACAALFDRESIEQVMMNLLSNAFRFTEPGGRITVTVRCDVTSAGEEKDPARGTRDGRSMLEVVVSDTGCGIPSQHLPHVFDRYYQVHAQSYAGGSGIGLALARELVRYHGGEIHVSSEEGQGTTFTFTLPLSGRDSGGMANARESENDADIHADGFDHPQAGEGWEETEISGSASARTTQGDAEAPGQDTGVPANADGSAPHIILLVDDHDDLREYMREILEPEYRVLEASNGREGMDMAVEHLPDLIITDVMMPVMDGFALCRAIRADERSSHIPVVMLTARGDDRSRHTGLEEGANDYLTKPFNPDELLLRVRNLLSLRRSLAEKFSAVSVTEGGFTLDEKQYVSQDRKFLDAVVAVIEERLDDESFSPNDLFREIGMSRTQFQRKIKALTGMSPSRFIRSVRLERARQMLEQNTGTVAEVAYAVGFNSQSYFTTCFRERFGMTPGQVKSQSPT